MAPVFDYSSCLKALECDQRCVALFCNFSMSHISHVLPTVDVDGVSRLKHSGHTSILLIDVRGRLVPRKG